MIARRMAQRLQGEYSTATHRVLNLAPAVLPDLSLHPQKVNCVQFNEEATVILSGKQTGSKSPADSLRVLQELRGLAGLEPARLLLRICSVLSPRLY